MKILLLLTVLALAGCATPPRRASTVRPLPPPLIGATDGIATINER